MNNKSSKRAWNWEPKDRFVETNNFIQNNEIPGNKWVNIIAEVDMTAIEARRVSQDKTSKTSYTSFVAKAVALAIHKHPHTNRKLFPTPWTLFTRKKLCHFQNIDICIAAELNLPGTYAAAFVDVMRNTDTLSLTEIDGWCRKVALCDPANSKQLSNFLFCVQRLPSLVRNIILYLPNLFPHLWVKWRGAATVISSPAKYGADFVVGAWPATNGISFGLVADRPVVESGKIIIKRTMNLTLSFDRTIYAGAQAARFLKDIVKNLEEAVKL